MVETLISSYLSRLDRFGKSGKIHSTFANSFNIEVNDRLINFNTAAEFLSSFGVQISQENFQKMQPYCQQGNPVTIMNSRLVLSSSRGMEEIELGPIRIKNLKFSRVPLKPEVLEKVIRCLNDLQLETKIGIELNEVSQVYFQQLRANQVKDWSEVATYLIGRGKGLTPSGDDILLGYLFMLKTYQHPQAPLLEANLQKNITATTSISENYFYALLEGFVSSVIFDLWELLKNGGSAAEIQKATVHLSKVGHTSGKDMCFGILLGALAVKNN
ncbi:DUF2877 domain-containing protein [Erwinia sp. CPCC 100877]|nr:DUF2877 domain-containing protein [Erwinia sp. CPCC 100877]